MCGINLIIDKSKSLRPDVILSMADRTKHRGPDEHKTKIIENPLAHYHLGANRLKITDHSSTASQPFFSEDQRYALLFNGEIYNSSHLKNQLLNHGIQFVSHSDTEVLFHWLKTFGSDRTCDLQGMFAFVFIDFAIDEVLVARDRFGIKPAYYSRRQPFFIFSSEIQPIVQTGLIPKELNKRQIPHYLQYKYVKLPETLYRDVYELVPGHVLKIHGDQFETISFIEGPDHHETEPIEISKVEELIKDSLLQQITAPVPIGLLLSGGVDSTLLLALAKEEGFSIPSFSIVNTREESSSGTNDFHYAKKAAQLYGSEHYEIKMDISILEQFETFITKMDHPIGDSSFLMTSEICRYASDSMKVLLSGAGADELFAGYNRHWAFHQYLKYKHSLNKIIPMLKFLSQFSTMPMPVSLKKQMRMFKKASYDFAENPGTTFNNFLSFHQMKDGKFNPPENLSNEQWLSWALEHDLTNYLMSDVLALSDKASMQHGVELRVPYLSEELVNYLKKGQAEYLLKNGRKWLLKELLIKKGGKEFATRPKEGFGLPLSHWLMNKRINHLWEFKDNSNHLIFEFLNKDLLETLLLQQRHKKADHGPLLWSILVLAHWLSHHFE